jgi:hypothetical protein
MKRADVERLEGLLAKANPGELRVIGTEVVEDRKDLAPNGDPDRLRAYAELVVATLTALPGLLALARAVLVDGCVLVPKVPTDSMVVDGFEAAFDCQEDQDEDTQGSCRGAAEIARATYAAMLAAAPVVLPAGEDGE